MENTILVIGATGHQGGAVVRQLLAAGFKVRAFTRDPAGKKAKPLAQEGVELFKGNLDDFPSLLAAMKDMAGAFCAINIFDGGVKMEEARGKRAADAAQQAGLSHYIYSSVGGADRRSGVPHFESKWRVEEYIRSLGIPHTILRPVAFMENFNLVPPAFFLSFMRSFLGAKKLQMISVEDIGRWAARAFLSPEAFLGHSVEIAGDELNYMEVQEIYEKVTGKKPMTIGVPASFVLGMMGDFGKMFAWFKDHGYQADIPQCWRTIPETVTFEKFLMAKNKTADLQPVS